MIPALKSELRKIYSVRSTYALLLLSVIAMGIFAFWVEGVKAGSNSLAATDPHKLAKLVSDAITNLAFWGSLVGVLTATHEYRYNTVMYTLTASRSRSTSLFAKVAAVTIFVAFFVAFVTVLSAAFMYIGLAIKGVSLVHQVIPHDLWWRILFEGWGSSMLGLILAVIIRQQVGAIATFFLIPVVVEQILGLLLKSNQIYLPFIALQQVTGLEGAGSIKHTLSPSHAALVVCTYLAVGWVAAWILFLRRDAS